MVRRRKSVWNPVFATGEVGSVLDTRSDTLHSRQNNLVILLKRPITIARISIPFLHRMKYGKRTEIITTTLNTAILKDIFEAAWTWTRFHSSLLANTPLWMESTSRLRWLARLLLT